MVEELTDQEYFGSAPSIGSIMQLNDIKPDRSWVRPGPMGFIHPEEKSRQSKIRRAKLWYLASPYAKCPEGKEWAFREVCKAAATLMGAGYPVFCPIAHMHPIETEGGLAGRSHAFYMKMDREIFIRCDGIIVLRLPGWQTSRGVNMERDWADAAGMPEVHMMDVNTIPEDIILPWRRKKENK